MKKSLLMLVDGPTLLLTSAGTQEAQNKLGRAVQNYTGTDDVLDV